MKTIGLLGGMSWESTLTYYQLINRAVQARMGGLHSAKLLLHSFDFEEIAAMQRAADWEGAENALVGAANGLKQAGAEAIVICTNTMHLLADGIEARAGLPVLHIADATAAAIQAANLKKVALLGTAFTMEKEFYKGRLQEKFGLEVLVPNDADRAIIHRVIFEELCQGKVLPAAKAEYLRIIEQLASEGAEGVILGCTEIGMLIQQSDVHLPVFDTTELHAAAAVEWMFS